MSLVSTNKPDQIADYGRLRTAISAVLYGSIWDGFNGPTGVSKDEALEYAAELALYVQAQLREVGHAPCCDYRDHSPGPCACPDHDASVIHPLGRAWFSKRDPHGDEPHRQGDGKVLEPEHIDGDPS